MRAFLAVLVAASVAAAEERTWDVRALAEPGMSDSAPEIGFAGDSAPSGLDEDLSVTGEQLAEFIAVALEPGTWDSGESWVEVEGDLLRVRHTPETLQAVATLLEYLTARAGRVVRLEAELLELSPAAAEGLAAGLLAEDRARELAAAAADPARARRVDRVVARTVAGRRTRVSRLSSRTYVHDQDVEVAKDAVTGFPTVNVCREGTVVDALPFVLSNDATVFVRFSFTTTRLRELKTFPLTEEAGGRVELPRRDVFQARLAAAVPAGRTVVLAATTWKCATPGWTAVLILRASLEGGSSAELAARAARAGFMAVNVGALLRGRGFWHGGPELGLPKEESGNEEGEFFVGEDLFVMSHDQILEEIRRLADEEAWSQPGRQAMPWGSQILMHLPEDLRAGAAATVGSLESRLGFNLACDSWLVALDPGEWRERRDALQRAGGVPEELFEELLDLARAGQAARFEAVSSVLGRTGLRFHWARGTTSAWVSDYDVELASGARGWDPVVGVVNDGLALDFTVRASGERLALDLRGALAAAVFGEPEDLKVKAGCPFEPVTCAHLSLACAAPAVEARPFLASSGVREKDGKPEVLLHFVRLRLLR